MILTNGSIYMESSRKRVRTLSKFQEDDTEGKTGLQK
jgi:hypothetical protein